MRAFRAIAALGTRAVWTISAGINAALWRTVRFGATAPTAPSAALLLGRLILIITRIGGDDLFIISLDIHVGHINAVHRHNACSHRAHNAGCGLELLDREIRADQMRIGFHAHSHAVAQLDLHDMFALGVHQVVDHVDRRFQQHLAGPLARAFFFQLA